MLTNEQLAILKAPFAPHEHEFLQGKAYITEAAITARIEQIDPSWTLEQVSFFNRATTAICTMRLTINGVWRDGVGMSQVVMAKSGNSEVNEAEKSAATDAMKRAARLFGIGRYLLELPDSVRDERSMAEYLNRGKKTAPSVGITTPAATTQQPAQKPATGQPSAKLTYAVNNFQTNLTKKNTPYLIFSVSDTEYAYSFTRDPFKAAGYDVEDWKVVGNHEMPVAAEITVEANKDGKLEVKSAVMVDPFAEKIAS